MATKTEQFFAWVWRANALILLAIAFAAIIAMGVIAYDIGIFANRDRPNAQVVEIAGTDLVTEELKLGSFSVIAGTDFLYAELAAPSKYIGSVSSGGLGTARNLLFFDTKSKKAHWLYEDTDNDIVSWRMVYNEPRKNMTDEKESRLYAIGMILQVAEYTEEPDPGRPRSLVLVSPDGKGVTTLVESIDSQLGQFHTDAETVLIFYVRDGAVNVLDVDPVSALVRSDSPLSVGD